MSSVWENEYPSKSEYAHYYSDYVMNVPKGNIIEILNAQMHEFFTFLNTIPGDKAFLAYEDGKWTLKEVVGHIIETERVFTHRALVFSRNDPNPLPGMDQEVYIEHSNYNKRTLSNLSNEYLAVRISGIHLFQNLTSEMIGRKGMASGVEFTVRSLPFIIAGHQIHHSNLIKEKYI